MSPTVQKGFGLGTTRGAMPLHHRTVNLPDEWDTSEGGYSINLISCSQCTAEKTFWQEAISSTFLLAVQKNSVSYIVDEVHASL